MKPVDPVVGDAVEGWQALRPVQPKLLDRRTNEMSDLLFAFWGVRLGPPHVNKLLIPILCKKAGAPAVLGHRGPSSTKLAKAFAEADYLPRNVRMVEVLIDAEDVRSGRAASGEAWKFYDLGHGYCTRDFFEQCPHRMACARCDYYVREFLRDLNKATLVAGVLALFPAASDTETLSRHGSGDASADGAVSDLP